MKWVKTEDKLPPEKVPVLCTNHAYLNPKNERFYVIAARYGDEYAEPETHEVIFTPDYWCEIEPPLSC
jgi:hypothetical protein